MRVFPGEDTVRGLLQDEELLRRTPPPIKYTLRNGKARTAILLWLLGIPIPVITLIFLIKCCLS